MKSKVEVCLLLLAIGLFAISAFFYSYQNITVDNTVPRLNSATAYPYRGIALTLVGTGSLLMITASISYSRRTNTSFRDLTTLTEEASDEQPHNITKQ